MSPACPAKAVGREEGLPELDLPWHNGLAVMTSPEPRGE